MFSIIRTIWYVFLHAFQKRITVQYPEQKPYLAPRYRGRIVLVARSGWRGALCAVQSVRGRVSG